MKALGHLGIAALAFTPVFVLMWSSGERRAIVVAVAVVGIGAMAPDVDLYVDALAHRGVTHTIPAAFVGGCVVGFIALAYTQGAHRSAFYGLVGTTAVLLHLVGDVLTPMGLRPLSPVSGWEVSLSLFLSRNPTVNRTTFAAGVGLLAMSWLLASGLVRPTRAVDVLTWWRRARSRSTRVED